MAVHKNGDTLKSTSTVEDTVSALLLVELPALLILVVLDCYVVTDKSL